MLRNLLAVALLAVASFTSPAVEHAKPPEPMAATAVSAPVLLPQPPPTTTTTTTQPPAPPTTQPQPPPPPTTTTQPAAPGECGGYVPLIQRYWPANQVSKVCQVIGCETGYTYSPTAENPDSTASGLLQFLDGTWQEARQYVTGAEGYARASHAPAEVQIAVGAAWWARTSWSQWECA